jgi:hypothetical protein
MSGVLARGVMGSMLMRDRGVWWWSELLLSVVGGGGGIWGWTLS